MGTAKGQPLRAIVHAAVLGGAMSCVAPSDTPRPRNVVLVVFDTLRADHLGTYGYARDTSPFLDQIAAQGVVFENVVAAAPATFPSVNVLLTSQSSLTFYENNHFDLGIPDEMETIAEVFRSKGFRTGAVSASPIVRRTPSRWNIGGGFGQGFERFDEHCNERALNALPYTASCVTARAVAIADSFGDDPFFLYVHYLDPHGPYQPPAAASIFADAESIHDEMIRQGDSRPIRRWLYEGARDPGVTDRDVRHLIDLYDGEIRAVDANVKHLLRWFHDRGILENTLFAFTADHGEAFMEHRHFAHALNVYQPVARVPLIFYWPARWPTGARRSEVACTADVMPTILSLSGVAIPRGTTGAALLEDPDGGGVPSRTCFTLGRRPLRMGGEFLKSVRVGPIKAVQHETGPVEVYDVERDPLESANLAGSARSDVADVARIFGDWSAAITRQAGRPPAELRPDAKAALEALGYAH